MTDPGDVLDAAGRNPNMFSGYPLGEPYRESAVRWAALPVYENREKLGAIIGSLQTNSVTIIASGTGSGKTVIVPKLCALLALRRRIADPDAPVRVAVTNPKSTTTISNAEYSAMIAEVAVGQQVGYLTRDAKAESDSTVLVYTTDGFLQSASHGDPDFARYAYLCLDEVHERSVKTDLLLLAVRNALVRARDSGGGLRAVIMSATMNADVFRTYFSNAGLSTAFIEVSGAPNMAITESFVKQTPSMNKYVAEAVKEVVRVLTKERAGDILVFVATAKDCTDGCAELGRVLGADGGGTYCRRLFSRANEQEKAEAVAVSPQGETKVVFATNLAESSITFSGLTHVIDCGRALVVRWDPLRNMRTNGKEWISKAEVKQRVGRVGREREGVAVHLYSEKTFNGRRGRDGNGPPNFPDLPDAAIRRDNPVQELLEIAGSKEHKNSWSSAMRDVAQLIDPPTAEQMTRTEHMLSFYRIIGEASGGPVGVDLTAAGTVSRAVTRGGAALSGGAVDVRLSAVGLTVNDIIRKMRVSLSSALLLLAGRLFGGEEDTLKVVAMAEATDGDYSNLWQLDARGNPVSLMDAPSVADPRSAHRTMVNIFDNMMGLALDARVVQNIYRRYQELVPAVASFDVNRRNLILRSWPWCLGNMNLQSDGDQFRACILVSRLYNACQMKTGGVANTMYVPNAEGFEMIGAKVALSGAAEGDIIVCDGFTATNKNVSAVLPTAFRVGEVVLQCSADD